MNQTGTTARGLSEAIEILEACLGDAALLEAMERTVDLVTDTLDRGGRILVCGNGGSMSDAMHFAEELSGRFRERRRALPALALSDPAVLTCIANDFGFEEVFARQVEAHGRAGDLLLVLSTSGDSKNVLRAVQVARERGLKTVGMTGRDSGALSGQADVTVLVPRAKQSDRIQEVHLVLLHGLIESIEARLALGTAGA
ncbi:MAG: phosphoheptose isomerase [Deltaproteobacteria bacterium]|nr:phosphoheptose isomerase [Deltaproteobacteria bacterium]